MAMLKWVWSRKWMRVVVFTVVGLFVLLYVVTPIVLNQMDGTVKPGQSLPESLAKTEKVVYPTQYLQRPGGTIAYDDSKTAGPLVVCVPGIGDLRQEYRFLVPQLTAAGFRVVTMDLRGMGESSVNWKHYSSDAVGTDIAALIQHLHAGPAFVIGDSMAGSSAIWADVDAPDQVKGLVLMDAFVRAEPVTWTQKLLLKTGFAGPWGIPMWSMFYKSEYPTTSPSDLALYRGILKANLRQPGRFAALKAMMNSSTDTEAVLGRVHRPSLVIMGSQDPDFKASGSKSIGQWLANQLHARLVMIPGAGHYPQAEMPKLTGTQIVDFLKTVSN